MGPKKEKKNKTVMKSFQPRGACASLLVREVLNAKTLRKLLFEYIVDGLLPVLDVTDIGNEKASRPYCLRMTEEESVLLQKYLQSYGTTLGSLITILIEYAVYRDISKLPVYMHNYVPESIGVERARSMIPSPSALSLVAPASSTLVNNMSVSNVSEVLVQKGSSTSIVSKGSERVSAVTEKPSDSMYAVESGKVLSATIDVPSGGLRAVELSEDVKPVINLGNMALRRRKKQ